MIQEEQQKKSESELGEAWEDRVKSYQEHHQVFGEGKWDNEQAASHITALNRPSLSANNKGLQKLPESIGNLQILYLSYNQLTSLPESLGKLQNLQKLYLSWNQLTGLPENIGECQDLMFLFVENNQLTSLPKSITSLQKLTYIRIADNPEFSITSAQKRWFKTKPNLKWDVNLDKIPVRKA